MNNKKSAFTFSEVMIGLVIIGVITAMVIPFFYNSHADKVRGTQLKKVCGQISIAISSIISDERSQDEHDLYYGPDTGEREEENSGFYLTSAGTKTSNDTQGAKYFLNKYFRHSKVNCGPDGTNDCVGKIYKTPEQKEIGTIPSGFYCIKTTNSAAICMKFDETDNVSKIIVDINGAEKPNITGSDLFVMYIENNGNLKDLDKDETHCNMDRTNEEAGILDYAAGCFTKAVGNGWVMPK